MVRPSSLVAIRDAFFPRLDIEDEKILPAIAEIIQSMPRAEQPPPPPLPIRLMLTLSWRKKFSAWVKPLLV